MNKQDKQESKRKRINAASKTSRLIVLVESETEDRINDARGKTSMSAWIRDAIEAKLMLFPNMDFRFSEVRRILESEKDIVKP
jgi:hypothetical protein